MDALWVVRMEDVRAMYWVLLSAVKLVAWKESCAVAVSAASMVRNSGVASMAVSWVETTEYQMGLLMAVQSDVLLVAPTVD